MDFPFIIILSKKNIEKILTRFRLKTSQIKFQMKEFIYEITKNQLINNLIFINFFK